MLRVVFDINVWLHAILGPASSYPYLDSVPPKTLNPSADCLSLALDGERFEVFASPHILNNIARVLKLRGYDQSFIRRYLEAVSDATHFSGGSILEPARKSNHTSDFEDNLILDLVAAVRADVLVTIDRQLLALSPAHGAAILHPEKFLQWLLR